MAYPVNTILSRIEPQGTPLDKIRVVGPSPVRQTSVESWGGDPGDCVIITPQEEFGANEVAPIVALNREYEVESMPDEEHTVIHLDPKRARLVQGLSPEEQFARAEREAAKADKAAASETKSKSKAASE